MIILFIVVLFEGCFLVRYFTRFTEEVFGCLISAIFIYEALSYLVKVSDYNAIITTKMIQTVSSIMMMMMMKRVTLFATIMIKTVFKLNTKNK